ncbi:protein FAM32A-like [Acanthaster planci]|uniref:Protein FAM32A-like n=1 Tax=Acanthaster planci TaxID=133434 RepID=A0A8B7Y6C5_ACAPL|nr:protein FAM32A-like [Acanthaster planci]
MASAYQAAGGTLKLKGIGEIGSKKKKKKKNASKQMKEQITMAAEDEGSEEGKPKIDRRTPAEKAFAKIQEKRQTERILEKAQKKHKDRVNEFNSKLDTLTEHFDIPKVSWTK